MMNLIESPWLPVLRRSNSRREMIAPWQISDVHDPVELLGFSRPDFWAGGMEFLIGLLQATFAPEDLESWLQYYKTPPSPEVLREAMRGRCLEAFNLMGPGPLFMQDFQMTCGEVEIKKKRFTVSLLLHDSPGESTVKKNLDFFQSRDAIQCLCPACSAIALFTFQAFALAGGQGNRTSLRGGGPLSSIVLGETLWETVWMNVLEPKHLHELADADNTLQFPWLAPTIISRPEDAPTTPEQVSPQHLYWGMPRRVKLDFQENSGRTPCSLCGVVDDHVCKHVYQVPRGYNYEGFRHPLTATVEKKGEPISHVHGRLSGLSFRDWPGMIDVSDDGKLKRTPPLALQVFRGERAAQILPKGQEFHVLVHGYDADKAKVRGWNEKTFSVLDVPLEKREEHAAYVAQMVAAANEVADILRRAAKLSLFGPLRKVKPGSTLLTSIINDFNMQSEVVFHGLATVVLDAVVAGAAEAQLLTKEQWLESLGSIANDILKKQVISQPYHVKAEHQHTGVKQLKSFASPRNKKLRKILGLGACQESGE